MNIRKLLEGKTIKECHGLITYEGKESGFEMILNNGNRVMVEGDFTVNVITSYKVGTDKHYTNQEVDTTQTCNIDITNVITPPSPLPSCPKCGCTKLSIERRPNGDTTCNSCGHKWPLIQNMPHHRL